jgi:phenylpyruvate tautomerase PptA (4-oxalocrotonate tautomerase family)
VSPEQKAAIAGEITRIHCGLNPGTPTGFVHVIFTDVAPGDGFVGGEISTKSVIIGLIRAGRSREIKTGLLLGISEAWQKITGQAEEDIVVGLQDIPAKDVVEGGLILPEPGEEEAWLAEHGLSAG